MSIRTELRLTCAGTIVASLLIGSGSAASVELLAPLGGGTLYKPIQSISYDFASKSLRGYFVRQDGKCLVVLMISDNVDPDESVPGPPTRVRVALQPGQLASIDSEADKSVHSLSVSCGEDAGSVVVTRGNGAEVVAIR